MHVLFIFYLFEEHVVKIVDITNLGGWFVGDLFFLFFFFSTDLSSWPTFNLLYLFMLTVLFIVAPECVLKSQLLKENNDFWFKISSTCFQVCYSSFYVTLELLT